MKSRILLFSLVSSISVSAADYQWDVNGATTGLGGTGAWDTTSLFWDATATGANDGTEVTTAYTFTNADTAVFGGTAGTVTLGTGVTLNGLKIDTAGYIITGNTITLAGTTPTITANASASVSSALAGTAGLIKAGTGNLTLSGANTFTGGTTVNAGTLTLARSAGFGGSSGSISTGALTVNSGAIATTSAVFAISGDNTASNTRVVNISGGTLNLASSEYIKTYNLTGGTINAPTAGSEYLRASAAGLIINSLASATTSTINNKVDLTFTSASIDVADGAAATDLTISGVISENSGAGSGAKTLTKTGAGTLLLSGVSTYTGGTTVSAGILDLGGSGGVGTGKIRGTVNVAAGAQLRLSTGDATGYFTDATRLSTINLNGATSLSSTGTLHVNTTSNQTLGSAVINMTGASITGIATSKLDIFGGASAINTLASATTSTISGIQLNLRQNNGLTLAVADGAAANDLTISSVISNSSGFTNNDLTKAGAGTLLLSGANTYSTNTNVNVGVVKVGNATAFGAANTAVTKVVVASGATVDFNGQFDATYGYTISGTGVGGSGVLVNNGAEIGTGNKQATNIKLAANASIGGTGNWALLASGYAATSLDLNAQTLTKVGANTVTLVNTTTTAGTIQISGGTLALGVSGTVNGSASAFTLDNTAGANLSIGVNSTVGSLAGGGTTGGNTSIGSGATLTVGALNTNTAYSGVISGAGVLAKTGSGILTLSGANTYSGGTSINAGTLVASSTNATNGKGTLNGGNLQITSGVTYNVDGGLTFASNTNATVSAVSGTATIQGFDVNSADVIVNTGVSASIASSVNVATNAFGFRIDNTGDLSIGGVISGTGSAGAILAAGTMTGTDSTAIWKKGNGTLTLTGANTFTAGSSVAVTSIQAGKVILSGGDNRLPSTSAVYLGSTDNTTGTLALNGINQTVTGLKSVGTSITSAVVGASATLSTLKINNTNSYTFGGRLGGAGTNENNLALNKDGSGTMTLSGVNTYTGDTTVTAGTLEIGGAGQLGSGTYAGAISNAGTLKINTSADQTLSGAITGAGSLVKDNTGTLTLSGNSSTFTGTTTVSAGTLLVSGQLGGDTSVSSAATLAGGGTVGGNLSFLSGSLLDIATALTGDALSVGGTVTFGSGFGIDNLAGVTWGSVSDGTYTLIDTTGTDFTTAGLDNFGLANAYDLGGGRSAYFNQGSLQLVVIPEPGAALLGGLGLLALLRRRRN